MGTGPAAAVLATLAAAGAPALPLFPDFLLAPGRLPLASTDWSLVPSPCPGIEPVLPAALACGRNQVAQVLRCRRRLQPAEAARLRTAALCLSRVGLPGAVVALIVAYVGTAPAPAPAPPAASCAAPAVSRTPGTSCPIAPSTPPNAAASHSCLSHPAPPYAPALSSRLPRLPSLRRHAGGGAGLPPASLHDPSSPLICSVHMHD